ncbi:hypothetical protein ACFL6I_00585 [candidate division KSB1 bacterium]
MLKGLKFSKIGMTVVIIGLLFALSGCTKYASEADLQELERQRQAALSAEQRVTELQREKADLERQIAAKERELQEAQRLLREVR